MENDIFDFDEIEFFEIMEKAIELDAIDRCLDNIVERCDELSPEDAFDDYDDDDDDDDYDDYCF